MNNREASDEPGVPQSIVIGSVLAIVIGSIVIGWVLTDPFAGFMSEGTRFAAVVVRNATGEDVTIEGHAEHSEWIEIPAWTPADQPWNGSMDASNWYGEHSRIGRDGCTAVPLRALDPNGEVIERRTPPLCDGDTWIIDGTVDVQSTDSE
jgi:hypothetical protein